MRTFNEFARCIVCRNYTSTNTIIGESNCYICNKCIKIVLKDPNTKYYNVISLWFLKLNFIKDY